MGSFPRRKTGSEGCGSEGNIRIKTKGHPLCFALQTWMRKTKWVSFCCSFLTMPVQFPPLHVCPSAQRFQVSPVTLCDTVPSPLSIKSAVRVVGADCTAGAAKPPSTSSAQHNHRKNQSWVNILNFLDRRITKQPTILRKAQRSGLYKTINDIAECCLYAGNFRAVCTIFNIWSSSSKTRIKAI